MGDRNAQSAGRRSSGRRVGDEWATASRRVLLGLHDSGSAGGLAKRFDEAGLLPTLAFSCAHLVNEARDDSYALILLDARFAWDPDSECLQRVREFSTSPILAYGDVPDGAEVKVDAVCDSDWDATEIVTRGLALVSLSRPVRLPYPLRWGPLEFDVARHQAMWHGGDLRLTRLQFRIMEVLALAGGSIVTVEQLARRVWGDSPVGERDRLVAHVRRIRRLIEDDPSKPQFLLRVKGRGFRLAEKPSAQPGR